MTNDKRLTTTKKYEDIEMSANTGMAIYLSGFIFLFGFAAVWHIIWLMIVSLVGSIACVIVRSFDEHKEYILTAAEVQKFEKSLHASS